MLWILKQKFSFLEFLCKSFFILLLSLFISFNIFAAPLNVSGLQTVSDSQIYDSVSITANGLTVDENGSVTSNGNVAVSGTGTMTVSGSISGKQLNNGINNIDVTSVTISGNGSFTNITNGTKATITISEKGTLNLTGNLANTGNFTNSGTINMTGGADAGSATTISGYGTSSKKVQGNFNIAGGFVKAAEDFNVDADAVFSVKTDSTFDAEKNFNNDGVVNVEGNLNVAQNFNNNSIFNVSSGITDIKGNFVNNTGGGFVSITGGEVSVGGSFTNSGTVNVGSNLSVGQDFTNNSIFNITAGKTDVKGSITNAGGGNLSISRGELSVGTNLDNSGNVLIGNNGSLSVSTDLNNNKTFNIVGGNVNVTNDFINNTDGVVKLSDSNLTIGGKLQNSGNMNISNSNLNITGNFINNSNFTSDASSSLNVADVTNDNDGIFNISGEFNGETFNNINGTLNIDGATASAVLKTLLNGSFKNPSDVNIKNGASLTVDDLGNSVNSNINIENGSLNVNDTFSNMNGNINIFENGSLNLSGDLLNEDGVITNNGTINMVGGTSRADATRIMGWGTETTKVNGNLNISGFVNVSLAYGDSFNTDETANIVIDNTGSLYVNGDFNNAGELLASGADINVNGDFTNTGSLSLNQGSSNISIGGIFNSGDGAIGGNINLTLNTKSDGSIFINADTANIDANSKLTVDFSKMDKLSYLLLGPGYNLISSNNGITGNFDLSNISTTELPEWIDVETIVSGNDVILQFKLNYKATQFTAGKSYNQRSVGAFLFDALKNSWIKDVNNNDNPLVDFVNTLLVNKSETDVINTLESLTLNTAKSVVSILQTNNNTFNSTIVRNVSREISDISSAAVFNFNTSPSMYDQRLNDAPINMQLDAMLRFTENDVMNDNNTDMGKKINAIRRKFNKGRVVKKSDDKNKDAGSESENSEVVSTKDVIKTDPLKSYNNVWVDVIQNSVARDATVNFNKFNFNTMGIVAGFERKNEYKTSSSDFAKYSYGFAVGTSKSVSQDDEKQDALSYYNMDGSNLNAAIYGTWGLKDSLVTGILSYGQSNFRQQRDIMFTDTAMKESATADVKSNFISLYGEYKHNVMKNLNMKAFGNAVFVYQNAFEESSDSSRMPTLGVKKTSYNDLRLGYGVEYVQPFVTPSEKYIIIPSFAITYSYNFANNPVEFETYFLSIGADKTFMQYSDDRDANILSFEAGLSWGKIVGSPIVARVNYSYDILDRAVSHNISFKLLKAF